MGVALITGQLQRLMALNCRATINMQKQYAETILIQVLEHLGYKVVIENEYDS